MKKNKQYQISFLNIDEKPTYKFTKLKIYRLVDALRLHAERSLTPSFVKNHLKELQTPFFEYKI